MLRYDVNNSHGGRRDGRELATAGHGRGGCRMSYPEARRLTSRVPGARLNTQYTIRAQRANQSVDTFATSILKKAGAYQYLCTFPGHNALMHGTFRFG